jgi:hypothetical protein
MKAAYAFLFFILFSFKGFSQFELPKKTISIAPISNSKGVVSPTSSKALTYPSIFDKKDKLGESVSLLKKKPEDEKSIFEKEQFASPAKEYTEKANKMLKTEGYESVVENRDFFFGEFKVYTETIYIGCRDYGNVDGDLIAIYLNGEKVIPLYELESGFNKYTFDLKLGLNTIEIEALNTGEFYPNTGAFTFLDGNEMLITAQQWGLNSGYKAVVKIYRIKGIELEVKK